MPPASEFASEVTNVWLPWIPGYTWVYKGVKDGEPTTDTVVATSRKKMILGVPTTVVLDTLKNSKGQVVEATQDYYAQDKQGNVWYFGESTAELTNGKVTSREGSWQAGVNGARPGLFMPAEPKPGDAFQQEFFKGQAEDRFKILTLDASGSVPWGAFTGAMLTEEWTPLEPGVVDTKYYVKGVGNVDEETAAGPTEYSRLVSFTKR